MTGKIQIGGTFDVFDRLKCHYEIEHMIQRKSMTCVAFSLFHARVLIIL